MPNLSEKNSALLSTVTVPPVPGIRRISTDISNASSYSVPKELPCPLSVSPRSINANNMTSGEWAYGREPRMASRPYPWMNLDAKSNASRIQSEYHLADELTCVKQDVELAQSHINVTLSV